MSVRSAGGSGIDAVLLSRIQFALTVGFHFIFPPLTIGLSWFIVWLLGRYAMTGSILYRETGRFWIRIFAATFAVGVATGITMEFQFGTNWAAYSRFVGDVFGTPLAIEAVFAFFLESTFLAVLLFGWKRFSPRGMWFASLMVAVGSCLSAVWILIANSWQQTPSGYQIVNGRAELTNLWAAALNPSTIPRVLHTLNACLTTGAVFVLGVSAWYLLKRRHIDSACVTLRAGLVIAFVTSIAQLPLGHYHAVQVAHTQPVKLAAYEGLFDTQKCAPIVITGIPRRDICKTTQAIRIPGLLSLLVYGRIDAEVKGLTEFPEEEWPPLLPTFYSFHLMVLLGLYLIALTGIGILLMWLRRLEASRLFLIAAVASIPLPFLANELGWIAAEVGRQPWVVYGVLKTTDAVSHSVPAGQILFSLLLFTVIYAVIFAAWLAVLRRHIRQGPLASNQEMGK